MKQLNEGSVQPHSSVTLPPVWNVPMPRNIHFTGRDAILSKLTEAFHSKERAVLPQVIKGMAGIGKTQIAVEYAFRQASIYQAVWWLRAKEKETLLSDYRAFATTMNLLENQGQDEKTVIDSVREWLTNNQNWLLILDDVKRPEDLKRYLPEKCGGHVIITTRHMVWEKSFCELPLLFWSRSESIDFLLRRADTNDPRGAAEVAEQLGDLPVAMELAGAYLMETEIDFGDYLQSHRKCQSAIKKASSKYPRTAGTAFFLSLQAIQNREPVALGILYLTAYLSSDGISRPLFSKAGQFVAPPFAESFNDPEALDHNIAVLERYGLVASISEDLLVNHLIQEMVREHLKTDERQRWADAAVRTIHHVFSPGETDGDQPGLKWDILFCHARTVVAHVRENGVALEVIANLLDSMRRQLQERGAFAEAETYFKQELDHYERKFGDDHPHAGAVANNLATLLYDGKRFDEAESYFRRALHIYQSRLGDDHLYTGAVTNNLALFLRDRGNDEEAALLFRQVWKIYADRLGEDNFHTAAALNNLAVSLLEIGDLAEAEPLFRKAIKTWENKLGGDHPHIATGLLNLSVLLECFGRYAEAEPYCRRAIGIRKTHSGGELLLVAEGLRDLVRVLKKQGKFDDAESICRQAVKIVRSRSGVDHPDTTGALFDLAAVLHDQGKFLDAEPLYLQVLHLLESQPDGDHPEMAPVLNNLSLLYHDLGRFADAERHCRRALEVLNFELGTDHPDTEKSRHNLSAILFSMGKTQEAAAPTDK